MRNRLLLGDSTERLREIRDESVDLVLTDPPYNTGIKGSASATRFRHFFDDRLAPADYRELVTASAREFYRVLREDRAAYVFMNWKSLGIWLDELALAGFRVKNVIVWDKVVHGMNYHNYAYTHEFLIFAVKGRFFPRNKRTGDDSYQDLWHIQREMGHRRNAEFHHETVKPSVLIRRPIEHASEPGDLVLDPFFGSGSILAVAKALGRDYIGIEGDSRFYKMGVDALKGDLRDIARVDSRIDVRAHGRIPPRHRRPTRRSLGRAWRYGRSSR
jgi:DNA modification methylase